MKSGLGVSPVTQKQFHNIWTFWAGFELTPFDFLTPTRIAHFSFGVNHVKTQTLVLPERKVHLGTENVLGSLTLLLAQV
jgi:hypothetical protein